MTRVLGIESSCDETAAAVVTDGTIILSNVVASQVELHARFGGVVPEVASRQHLLAVIPIIEQALAQAQTSWDELSAVAVTVGPGLAGSLLVGVNTAKALAFVHGLPLVGVNHLEAHIYANWLTDSSDLPQPTLEFPLVCLIVSGGHSDLVLMRDHGEYQLLGRTRDDAAGEAFDKVARILGLGYPGGPAIERAAQQGNPAAFHLPRAWLRGSLDFSFSGLKTAAWRLVEKGSLRQEVLPGFGGPAEGDLPSFVCDLAAAFQGALVDVLATKTAQAASQHGAKVVLLAGGVAANAALRQVVAQRSPVPVRFPPPHLCTDNAAMTAACGFFRWRQGHQAAWDLDVLPGWRLT